MKKNTVVIGAQWGDEGKGKIVDLLARQADAVARFQGGANAGHTVKANGREFVLHLLPSGIVHPQKPCFIGNGVVLDPQSLMEEIAQVRSQGIRVEGRLKISPLCNLTMPYHKMLDRARESQGAGAIGTTGRGIGPSYIDKVGRLGIRLGDLLQFDVFAQKLKENLREKNFLLKNYYRASPASHDAIIKEYRKYPALLKPYTADVSLLLNQLIAAGKKVLFEGAQGTFLDIDFGTYPFVTSSSTISGGTCTGLGIGPAAVGSVLLVAKAYTTRVGNGPFPAEFDPKMADFIRRKAGDEFGRTTGRPRRCGWFDAVMIKRAVQVNGADQLAVTKLDVLDGIKQIKIAVSYGIKGGGYPWTTEELARCRVRYLTLPGWDQPTGGVRSYAKLPANAKRYLQTIEKLTGAKISIVSVGPDREATIFRA
ncbi:MAG: adenylosuccinate synthase [Candidatus Edwardsbacteria bacterium]|nr:adenylosuccinate synthase [Candidatus Edwardsbacteria bacterium]